MGVKKRVFLSYHLADKAKAQVVSQHLLDRGLHVGPKLENLGPDSTWDAVIGSQIEASDYLLVLLSPKSVESEWILAEVTLARNLAARDITIVPVLLEDCEIPLSLRTFQYVDLREHFEERVGGLADSLGVTPNIDFQRLKGRDFEDLVLELLLTLGFMPAKNPGQLGFDFLLMSRSRDVFGAEVEETWAVEAKLYREARPDLRSIRSFLGAVACLTVPATPLLITNGQLTSVVLEYIRGARVRIRVVEGPELKRLLLAHPNLVTRYFGSRSTSHE